ncbi:MAG TPA: hypothetical protein VHH90_01985 [Polyangia bacterium]|nr:hypothetical protein [Polyangia bacterium]
MESAHRPRSSSALGWGAAAVALVVLVAQAARADAPVAGTGAAVQAPVDGGALGPTAPEAAAAPIVPVAQPGSPMSPTLTPDLPAVAAPALDQPTPAGPVPQGKAFYRKDWFWGALGVVVLTATIVLVATSGSSPDAPVTTLGNMRAF